MRHVPADKPINSQPFPQEAFHFDHIKKEDLNELWGGWDLDRNGKVRYPAITIPNTETFWRHR